MTQIFDLVSVTYPEENKKSLPLENLKENFVEKHCGNYDLSTIYKGP